MLFGGVAEEWTFKRFVDSKKERRLEERLKMMRSQQARGESQNNWGLTRRAVSSIKIKK